MSISLNPSSTLPATALLVTPHKTWIAGARGVKV
jgi:hypothetical protein